MIERAKPAESEPIVIVNYYGWSQLPLTSDHLSDTTKSASGRVGA